MNKISIEFKDDSEMFAFHYKVSDCLCWISGFKEASSLNEHKIDTSYLDEMVILLKRINIKLKDMLPDCPMDCISIKKTLEEG